MTLPSTETNHISCVIPTLNNAETIETALLSLKAQREVRVQILVADSGSTDDTLKICQRHQVPVIYVPPGNMYCAINAGLRECRTEWLAYLNSDDFLYADAYARLLSCGEKSQADVVYGNCDFVDAGGRFLHSMSAGRAHELLPLFRCQVMGLQPHATVFRQRVFADIGGFDERYRYSADADFFIRLLRQQLKFTYCSSEAVACFRLHGGQLTHTKTEAMNAERVRIFGDETLKPRWTDQMSLLTWRTRNLPHYLLRILRASLLTGRLALPGSMDVRD
jgi:glycosyltransferase involved in cell wall biosynthesis